MKTNEAKKRIESLESGKYSIHNEVAGFKLSIVRELQHVKNQKAVIQILQSQMESVLSQVALEAASSSLGNGQTHNPLATELESIENGPGAKDPRLLEPSKHVLLGIVRLNSLIFL